MKPVLLGMRYLILVLAFHASAVAADLHSANPASGAAPIIDTIDDFEDADSSDWSFFGGANAGGGGGVLSDRPYEGDFYFSTGWGGDGTASGFYGGIFKNLDNAAQVPIPDDPWFSVWVLNQSDATVDQFTLEITLREDLDGDGWEDGQEDSIGLNTTFTSARFNDKWTLISAPLSAFTNRGTGGDGVFNGALDEVVLVIAGVQGVFGSTVEIDFDQIRLTSGPPINVIDDFEDGDFSDWGFFPGNNAGGIYDISSDRPYEGNSYFNTSWVGEGTASGFYGGIFKNLDNTAQVSVMDNAWFSVWVLNQSDATVDQFTLEITLREDLDGDGWTNGQEDSIRLDTSFTSSRFNDKWTLISAPLSDFINLGTGGDGVFNGALDEVVLVIAGVQGALGSTVEIDFDLLMLTPVRPVSLPVVEFDNAQLSVLEGETAVFNVFLDDIPTTPVTVNYASAESTARTGRQYTPVSGTLTFEVGETLKTIAVPTFSDGKHTGDRRVVINLYEDSAPLGFQRRAVLTIVDKDAPDTRLVDDFEGFHPFINKTGDVLLSSQTILETEAPATPYQLSHEDVLSANFDTGSQSASFDRIFSRGQDWSDAFDLNFWYYGSNSGQSITMQIKDNMAATTATVDPSGWVLAWSDEFNDPIGTPPNPNIWQKELGDGALANITGWGNSELQYYTNDPSNAATDGNGNLVISLRDVDTETTNLVCWYGPCQYTSARLNTQQRLDFEYGRIEARIQVPDGPAGIWPAFWMLGDDISAVGWPQTGEIDIMEYVSRNPNEVFGTVHGPGYFGGQAFGNTYDFAEPVSKAYHTFVIEWGPDTIEWYVDGIQYHSAVPADVAPNEWVYNHPFFLLLNTAIGGNFGGAVDAGMTSPQDTLVDYVRVYQAADTAERFESAFTDNFSGWQKISLPFNSFSRSTSQPAGAPDDGLTLNEIWGYGFMIPEQTSGYFYLDRVSLTLQDLMFQDGFEQGAQ